jgi:hypothetical protein
MRTLRRSRNRLSAHAVFGTPERSPTKAKPESVQSSATLGQHDAIEKPAKKPKIEGWKSNERNNGVERKERKRVVCEAEAGAVG